MIVSSLIPIPALFCALLPAAQQETRLPVGPIHMDGDSLVDSTGQAVVLKGTEIPDPDRLPPRPGNFSSFSATTFATIRQRWNMNAIRITVDPEKYLDNPEYRHRLEETVSDAALMDLVSILATDVLPEKQAEQFWGGFGADFKDNPRVIFEVPNSADRVRLIRSNAVAQPILVSASTPEAVAGIGRVASSLLFKLPMDRDQAADFIPAKDRGPTLVRLDESDLLAHFCSSGSMDSSDVESLVDAVLVSLDRRGISWIVSSFRPGKLIGDYRYYDATTLENGCNQKSPSLATGIGMAVQFHLFDAKIRGLFTVSGHTGGFVLPRGGLAISYGPTLALEEAGDAGAIPLPTRLGGISVRVTDSSGVARLAGLAHVLAGWGQINFVVPSDCTPGPAEITVLRLDGSTTSGTAIIADIAPGLSARGGNGRGPAVGEVIQAFRGGGIKRFSIGDCKTAGCWTNPIRLSRLAQTTVCMVGSGFRNVHSSSEIEVRIGGRRVPVLSYGPFRDPGMDQVSVSLPSQLQGLGETDLIATVDGKISNVVRIRVQ